MQTEHGVDIAGPLGSLPSLMAQFNWRKINGVASVSCKTQPCHYCTHSQARLPQSCQCDSRLGFIVSYLKKSGFEQIIDYIRWSSWGAKQLLTANKLMEVALCGRHEAAFVPSSDFHAPSWCLPKHQIVPCCLCNCPLDKCSNDSSGSSTSRPSAREQSPSERGKLATNKEDCGFLRHRCRNRHLTAQAYRSKHLITRHTGGTHQDNVK